MPAPPADGAGRSGSASVLESAPAAAAEVFGARLSLAEAYAQILVTDGVLRGVIGPHEPGRIWSRHLLNCAVLTELFGIGERIVDVGSGAGLPGLVLAIRRADLRLDLVEPLQRRVAFLVETVDALGLSGQVRVVRGRADECAVLTDVGNASWVTARAVASLDQLVRWCLPMLASDGHLALMKGASAADELAKHRRALERAGASNPHIVGCGAGLVDPLVSVVMLGGAGGAARRKGKR